MTIAIYGATGYTGRLVTEELTGRGADLVLGGRSSERLERVAREHGGGAPVRTAATDDPASLRALFEDASVVINCAGPFTELGEAVVQAAIETRTHYLDSSGEQGFMRAVLEDHGEAAEQAGVAVVPGFGFDSAPGDCAARLAAEGHEPVEEVIVAYAVEDFAPSRGTMQSALEAIAAEEIVYRDGDWTKAPGQPHRASFEFPSPTGRQPVMRLPAGEVLTVPRHTNTARVTTLIAVGQLLPHAGLTPFAALGAPLLAGVLRTPVRRLLERAIGKVREGPDKAARERTAFAIVALARGSKGIAGRTVVHGRDIYGTTAAALAYGAEQMSEQGYDRSGTLPPAGAFDARGLLTHLAGYGLSFEVD